MIPGGGTDHAAAMAGGDHGMANHIVEETIGWLARDDGKRLDGHASTIGTFIAPRRDRVDQSSLVTCSRLITASRRPERTPPSKACASGVPKIAGGMCSTLCAAAASPSAPSASAAERR